MSDVRKYFVARGPFHVPAPVIEEGDIVELDSAVAAQFVREGTLNPSGFECDGGGNPIDGKADVDADAQAKADAEAAQAEADAKAKADADAEAQAAADAQAKADAESQKVGDVCKLEDGTDGVLAENPDGADKPLVCVAPAGE